MKSELIQPEDLTPYALQALPPDGQICWSNRVTEFPAGSLLPM